MEPIQHTGKAPLTARTIVKRCIIIFAITVLSLVISFGGALWIIFNGPSERAKNEVSQTFLSRGATKWVVELFLTDEELEQMQPDGQQLRPIDE